MVTESSEELLERLAVMQGELTAVSDERDALRARVDADLNATVNDWLSTVVAYATVVPDVHNTFSWRVTRPLRQVRTLQLKVARIGILPAVSIAGARLRRRLNNRRLTGPNN